METFGLGIIVGFVIAALVGLGMGLDTAYDRGYCEALGGERITTSTCNVDGKVVEVP